MKLGFWGRRGALKAALASGAAAAVLAIVFLGGGWAIKDQCSRATPGTNPPTLDWANNWPWHHLCYSDVVALYGAELFNKSSTFPYKTSWVENPGTAEQSTHYTEYPVLTGLFMWVNAQATHAFLHLDEDRLPEAVYFDIVAYWLAIAWLVVVWAVWHLTGVRKRDALLVAGSPLLLTQAFTNFDVLAVALATAGMLAWARRRPALAGVLLGLGAAAKLYPLFLLLPLVALCLRERRFRPALTLVGSAAAAWIVVNAPIAILYPKGWAYFYKFSEIRGAGFEAIYTIISYFTHWGGFDGPLAPNQAPTVLNTFTSVVFIGFCAAIVGLALLAPRRPRVPQLGLLVVVAFLLTNKVYSPQYSLWLVPLAVLALPRPWLLLAWMTLDASVWIPTMFFQVPPGQGSMSQGLFSVWLLARDAALVLICALVVRDIFKPSKDPVRILGQDDPCGGILTDPQPAQVGLAGAAPATV
jgi:uncharacterized membrane protein